MVRPLFQAWPQELITASGFGAPLALPVTSIVPAAVGASDARASMNLLRIASALLLLCFLGWLRFRALVGPFVSLVCLRGLLLMLLLRPPFACALSTWGQITSQSSYLPTKVIGVFCRSAGADQNSEQALRALPGGLESTACS